MSIQNDIGFNYEHFDTLLVKVESAILLNESFIYIYILAYNKLI